MIKSTLILSIILLVDVYSFAQQSSSKKLTDTNYEKWAHATINLETRDYSHKDWRELERKYDRKEINFKEYVHQQEIIRQSIKSFTGTAVFCRYGNRHYLLTARHVIEGFESDEVEDDVAEKLILVENGSALIMGKQKPNNYDQELMINLSVGVPGYRSYLFSSRAIDLAVICLNSDFFGNDFAELLISKGYIPILLDDLESADQLQKGQEITAIGFPGDLFQIGTKGLDKYALRHQSDIISLPVITKGAVVDPLPGSNYFSGGIYVTNGNSGGPIVSHNKLIGIVLNWTSFFSEIKSKSFNYYFHREMQFGKAKNLVPMIKELAKRMDAISDRHKEMEMRRRQREIQQGNQNPKK